MGGTYPGPGATIGPAMAFGRAAVNAVAATLEPSGEEPSGEEPSGQDSLPL